MPTLDPSLAVLADQAQWGDTFQQSSLAGRRADFERRKAQLDQQDFANRVVTDKTAQDYYFKQQQLQMQKAKHDYEMQEFQNKLAPKQLAYEAQEAKTNMAIKDADLSLKELAAREAEETHAQTAALATKLRNSKNPVGSPAFVDELAVGMVEFPMAKGNEYFKSMWTRSVPDPDLTPDQHVAKLKATQDAAKSAGLDPSISVTSKGTTTLGERPPPPDKPESALEPLVQIDKEMMTRNGFGLSEMTNPEFKPRIIRYEKNGKDTKEVGDDSGTHFAVTIGEKTHAIPVKEFRAIQQRMKSIAPTWGGVASPVAVQPKRRKWNPETSSFE